MKLYRIVKLAHGKDLAHAFSLEKEAEIVEVSLAEDFSNNPMVGFYEEKGKSSKDRKSN